MGMLWLYGRKVYLDFNWDTETKTYPAGRSNPRFSKKAFRPSSLAVPMIGCFPTWKLKFLEVTFCCARSHQSCLPVQNPRSPSYYNSGGHTIKPSRFTYDRIIAKRNSGIFYRESLSMPKYNINKYKENSEQDNRLNGRERFQHMHSKRSHGSQRKWYTIKIGGWLVHRRKVEYCEWRRDDEPRSQSRASDEDGQRRTVKEVRGRDRRGWQRWSSGDCVVERIGKGRKLSFPSRGKVGRRHGREPTLPELDMPTPHPWRCHE